MAERRDGAGNFQRAWAAYARRRGLALFLLFGGVPFCGAAFLVAQTWLHEGLWSVVAMAVWWLATAAAVWWAGEFRCPRCHRRFGALGSRRGISVWRGLFDTECANCKLRRWESG